jgi:RNase H-fold protein (predicted Holliday junction resolvase)
MQVFSSDTQIVKFNKSFVVAIGDIEKQVNRFIELFSNLESKDFAAIVVKSIENIKKETAQLDQIIEDRIKPYIENNILAINWTDSVSEELQEKVEKRVPLTVRLVEEREGSNKAPNM